jgi:hypothetical protein
MTLYEGAILNLENQPSGLQRRFKVVQYSYPKAETYKDVDGNIITKETQIVRLEIVE